MDFTSSCSREAMAAAGSMSPRSSMSRAIFTWVSTSWVRTPSPRRSPNFASISVRDFVASANWVLRPRAFSSIPFAISGVSRVPEGELLRRHVDRLFQIRRGPVGERAAVRGAFQVRERFDRELGHEDPIRSDLRLLLERPALLRRPHQDVAGLQVVRHERPVLRDPRDDLLLRGPSDLRDRLRVETESLHRPDLGLETLQGLLVLAEPFVERSE